MIAAVLTAKRAIIDYIVIFRNLIQYYMNCIKHYKEIAIHYMNGARLFTAHITIFEVKQTHTYSANGLIS